MYSNEEIIDLYKHCKHKKQQIEILCELTLLTRKEILKILGLNAKEHPPKVKAIRDPALEERKEQLYRQGKSIKEMARELGVCDSCVGVWLRKKGYGKKTKNTSHARYLEQYNSGLTDTEIATELGVSTSAVRSWRNRNHFKINKKKV